MQVYITDLTNGSVIITASIVINTGSIPAFATALADNHALPLTRYLSTNLDCGELPTGPDLAAIVQQIAGVPPYCPFISAS